MNSNLLAIDYSSASTVAADLTPSRSPVSAHTTLFSLTSVDNSDLSNSSKKIMTNNILAHKQQSDTDIKPVQDFVNMCWNKISPQVSWQGCVKAKSKKQSSSVEANAAAEPLKSTFAHRTLNFQTLLTYGIAENERTSRQQIETKSSFNKTKLINDSDKQNLATSLQNNCPKSNLVDSQEKGAELGDKTLQSNNTGAISRSFLIQTDAQQGRIKDMTKYSAQTGKEAMNPDSKAYSADQKTANLNLNLLSDQRKSSDPKQDDTHSPIKPKLTTEKSTDSSIYTKPVSKKIADVKLFSEAKNNDAEKSSDNILCNSFFKGLRITEMQISNSQSKGGSNSKSDFQSHDSSDIQQLGSDIEFGKIFTSTQPDKSANSLGQILDSAISGRINEQVAESIYVALRQGDRHITIQLNPPDLGRIFVKFQQQEDEISVLLEVNKAQTRNEIERALPQVIQSLTDLGVQIKRLEVQMSDQPESRFEGNFAGDIIENSSFQHRHSFEGGSLGYKFSNESTAESTYNILQKNPEPQLIINDRSINMLI